MALYERSSTDQLGQDSTWPGLKFPENTFTMPCGLTNNWLSDLELKEVDEVTGEGMLKFI